MRTDSPWRSSSQSTKKKKSQRNRAGASPLEPCHRPPNPSHRQSSPLVHGGPGCRPGVRRCGERWGSVGSVEAGESPDSGRILIGNSEGGRRKRERTQRRRGGTRAQRPSRRQPAKRQGGMSAPYCKSQRQTLRNHIPCLQGWGLTAQKQSASAWGARRRRNATDTMTHACDAIRSEEQRRAANRRTGCH